MIGQRVAHYRITAAIGAGGMGQVYRATDTKLGRDIALKVLPPDMAGSAERLERFQREARAVAALNHPHVVTIYSVEEADGIHFLTMELVDGVPLDRLIRAGGMELPRMLGIAGGLADALCAAHDKGIIHRDLKPANVMVTKTESVKVLDFGLARITAPAEATLAEGENQRTEVRTSEGVVMGTIPYMSPEQLHGQALDHRTDIFSLGVMLYEMACGERPFRGDSSVALASAILRDTPRPLTDRRKDLPEGLIRIINRCLEKSASGRFPSARDLRGALGGVIDGSLSRPRRDFAVTDTAARTQSNTNSREAGTDEGFGVAVMPFKFSGGHSGLEVLAAGLTDDIVAGFSRFPYLRVRSTGKETGARYVMEGTLRQAGTRVRLAVQLVDTESGARIWAESYERAFDPDAAFELQDDLVHRIVGTCADQFGVLARSISEAVRGRDPGELGPYEALMRGFGYHHRLTEAEHAAAREVLERAVERAPSNADCWAMLAWVTSHEYGHGFNPRPDSLDRALGAALRAVDLAPSNPLAQQALAVVSFFRKETAACLSAAERAIALNPLDTGNEAMFLITFSGDWDRGCALIRRAMDLNPHHPGWFELTLAINEYRLSNYREALHEVARANAPEMFWSHAVLAASQAQLGERTAAGNALRELLARKKDFVTSAGELLAKWFDPQLAAHWMDGLRKAGLEVVSTAGGESPAPESSRSPLPVSGAVRADEGFWVAVLPFRYSGSSADLLALAEGLTEEIVTGLSRFSYLRVIARGSTSRFASESADVRTIGRELGARYVMEGSLRQAGSSLRVTAQLVDAESGAHLWAETFSRPFEPAQIFEIQDDLAPRIVSTVADMNGVLPHMMSEALRGRQQLPPYEAVLRSFGYLELLNAEEHAEVRAGLERALETAPGYADGLAMLSNLYAEEFKHGFNAQPDPLGRALEAARRAVAAAPSNHLAYHVLAQALFFRKEFAAFKVAAERAVALNPMDGCTTAYMGILLAYTGAWERGMALAARAMELNPNHPGWYRFAAFTNALRKRDYRAALDVALEFNMPSYFYTHVALATAYGHLGETESAANALRELLTQKPDFALTAREELAKWNAPELLAEYMEGLRKAGLSIPPAEV